MAEFLVCAASHRYVLLCGKASHQTELIKNHYREDNLKRMAKETQKKKQKQQQRRPAFVKKSLYFRPFKNAFLPPAATHLKFDTRKLQPPPCHRNSSTACNKAISTTGEKFFYDREIRHPFQLILYTLSISAIASPFTFSLLRSTITTWR